MLDFKIDQTSFHNTLLFSETTDLIFRHFLNITASLALMKTSTAFIFHAQLNNFLMVNTLL